MPMVKKNQFWMDRPTFVTGATGILGSSLVGKLIDDGADIICLVRDWVPQSELVRSTLVERVKVVRGDVREQATLERILGEYEIDTVFHLAAQTIVPIANRNPVSTFETNIGGTWSILEACRRSPRVKQVIIASSDKAYGSQTKLPYTEAAPLQGNYPYDVSKSCADLLAQTYAATFALPVAITRCGNFYGGGDLNWNRVVPGTIRSIIRGLRPVIRSDGQNIRDYFFVEDAAMAYRMLAEKLAKTPELAGEAFNFTYEKPTNVIEMVNIILRLMNSSLEPIIQNEASGEIKSQYLSADKARKILGWKPAFSLEEGLSKTIGWYQDFFGAKS
jgi:CDP-glucose 4,6-dehydratase